MLSADYEATPELNETFKEVRKLGLEENIAELDAYGFTVVEPDKVAPPDFQKRVREAVLAVYERRSGRRVEDLDAGTIEYDERTPGLVTLYGLLYEDRVFEQVLLNPVVLTLARYLNGRSMLLSVMGALIKSRHDEETGPLHSDINGVPQPFPPYAQTCNVTWIHTDYTKDNGATVIVPGSHRLCRPPEPYEADASREDSPVKRVAVEAPAGSIIFWHGNTWHASPRKMASDLRINTLMYFCRSYLRQYEDHARRVTADMLERNPPEFAELLGCKHPWPIADDQRAPQDKVEWFRRAGANPWS